MMQTRILMDTEHYQPLDFYVLQHRHLESEQFNAGMKYRNGTVEWNNKVDIPNEHSQ